MRRSQIGDVIVEEDVPDIDIYFTTSDLCKERDRSFRKANKEGDSPCEGHLVVWPLFNGSSMAEEPEELSLHPQAVFSAVQRSRFLCNTPLKKCLHMYHVLSRMVLAIL